MPPGRDGRSRSAGLEPGAEGRRAGQGRRGAQEQVRRRRPDPGDPGRRAARAPHSLPDGHGGPSLRDRRAPAGRRNVWVGGKVVELALRLPGGKLLPMDSKWVSSVALEQLAEPGLDANRRAQLTGQVEREVERRVREVSQYIDPSTTSPFALAVIPDAAYDVCRSAIVNAHSRHVMVVGYGMALPYLLTLYQLHLQFARTVDMEKLQSALIDIERQVDVMEGILDNRVQRSLTVLQNAYTEGKQASARIRASARSAQISEVPGDKVFSSPSHGEVGRRAGGAAGDNVSTDSPGAAGDLSTETLHLALLDSAQ
ncbi:MAG: DNA recombination protein RmuC [Chloroflexi bacterium]|nr:MAG: DNA recombination protein RmuC [Chloroflexota bacterium]